MTQEYHNIAIEAMNDATGLIWNERSIALKKMLPLYDAAPELLHRLEEAYRYMISYNKCDNSGLLQDIEKTIERAKK